MDFVKNSMAPWNTPSRNHVIEIPMSGTAIYLYFHLPTMKQDKQDFAPLNFVWIDSQRTNVYHETDVDSQMTQIYHETDVDRHDWEDISLM